MLAYFLPGEFLLHIPCWLYFSVGIFFYIYHAGFMFLWGVSLLLLIWGVSLTHPVLASFLSVEFLSHIPCCLYFMPAFFFFCLGNFSHTSRAVFIFILGSVPYPSRAGFIFNWGVSLTHPMLASFLPGEFLLHIPRWLYFSVGCFSYTSHADFFYLIF